ncbi:unnamed protein product [Linum tenue]|uniref:F-box domain-containing protein n=1 Tax=Linum tenue TaxID=586396 RepID=A0AAV0QQX6_9ROSI|nr:unnamed protein product [Linum tenue]
MAASTEVNSSTTTTTTTIVQLGDDLLVEILIRLPNPRFTCRCKAVCKRWNSLISDPIRFNRRFVSHHQSRNRQPPLLLHSDDPRAIIRSFIPMTTSRTHSSFSVMDSYKDLVLCGFSNVGPASGYSEPVAELYRSYLLCNPFTKQWVALPLAPELPTGCWHFFTRLVCEPRISNDLDLGEEVFAYSSEFRFRVISSCTCHTISDFIVASGKVDEVPGATPVLKSEIMAEVEAILEPLLQLPHGPPLIQRALFFYHRQLLQKLLFVDSVTMANDVQLAALFPGVDPKSAINSECNEVVQFLTHSHREDVTYRAMTVYRVFLMQGLGGFKTEVRVSDKQLSGSAAQTIQGTLAQPTTLHNNLLKDCISRILDASKMREFKTEVRASDKQLSGSVAQTTQAAAGVGDPTVAQNVPLDAAVAGG